MRAANKDVIAKHESLKKEVAQHDYYYHTLDKPVISDQAYDKLFSELQSLESEYSGLETKDSPTQRAGGSIIPAFSKAPHRRPMLSLQNSYSKQDLFDFDEKLKKFLNGKQDISYFCELKFDGLALELIYADGFLVKALTRGDGTIGEDVTENIKTIRTVPLRLRSPYPQLVEVRGEVIIFKKDFLKMNEDYESQGLAVFANPRNAAAGTVRQLDPKIAASRPLRFFAYALGEIVGDSISSQTELQEKLSAWGMPVCSEHTSLAKTPDAACEFYDKIERLRPSLPFDIDGIVVKVNDFKLQDDLGLVARSPRWATAAKFKPEQAESLIEDIRIQVGRTGVLTPVAQLKPTRVGGVVITNATLHNMEEIQRKDIRIGDAVIIQRAGDVIPEVVEVLLNKRSPQSNLFQMPLVCPSCSGPVQKTEGEVAYRCVNPFCPSVLKESLKHFSSRRAMNIEKFGDRVIDSLVDQGHLKSFSDIYKLTLEVLLSLERQGEKSAANILTSIEKSKKTTMAKLLHALGIRFVGETTAQHLALHFGTFENLMAANEEELSKVPEIGPKVARAIIDWFANKKLVSDLHQLFDLGITLEKVKRNNSGPLSGKSFVITGTLPVRREDAKDWIEKNGGKILSGVSSKLDYLVVGDDPGSKAEKAQNLGVKIVSWDELQKLAYLPVDKDE